MGLDILYKLHTRVYDAVLFQTVRRDAYPLLMYMEGPGGCNLIILGRQIRATKHISEINAMLAKIVLIVV